MRCVSGAKPLLIGVFSVVAAACGGNPVSLTSPSSTPASAQAPQPTYTLFGSVSSVTAATLAAVVGVQVSMAGKVAITDRDGYYSIPGLPGINSSVMATKAGYRTETTNLVLSGDTRIDFRIVRTATDTLSGKVSEMTPGGQVPVEGVRIEEMSCDQDSYGCVSNIVQAVATDANGFYSIPGLYPGTNNFVWVTKPGYEPDGMPSNLAVCDGCNEVVTINGDTRFDISLIRR